MFEVLPRDWNLKPIFTQKWASVDINWGCSTPNPPQFQRYVCSSCNINIRKFHCTCPIKYCIAKNKIRNLRVGLGHGSILLDPIQADLRCASVFRPTSNPIHRTPGGENIFTCIQKSVQHFELMHAVHDVNTSNTRKLCYSKDNRAMRAI